MANGFNLFGPPSFQVVDTEISSQRPDTHRATRRLALQRVSCDMRCSERYHFQSILVYRRLAVPYVYHSRSDFFLFQSLIQSLLNDNLAARGIYKERIFFHHTEKRAVRHSYGGVVAASLQRNVQSYHIGTTQSLFKCRKMLFTLVLPLFLLGGSADNVATEYGLNFHIDWLKGQKTGFFVDQRENRALLERYARGRNVLNMFCYTGGFSVYAMRGGALSVHSVDSSAKAIDLTNKNIALNFPDDARHAAYAEDAFKFLERMEDGAYDLIVLDPPAFAKHRDALRNALQGYRKLNARAFEKIRPGGILFTFSCSQAVNKDQFRMAIFTAAAQSGRSVRILHQLTQPADHPVNIYHPEGEYLKGLVLYVE